MKDKTATSFWNAMAQKREKPKKLPSKLTTLKGEPVDTSKANKDRRIQDGGRSNPT